MLRLGAQASDRLAAESHVDGRMPKHSEDPELSNEPSAVRRAARHWSAYGPEIAKGLDYLNQFIPAEGVTHRESYYFYGHYYAVQAMWQAGGERWARWFPAIRDELIGRQRDDGSWMSPKGNEYATAMSCIILQIPNNYLPIFQR